MAAFDSLSDSLSAPAPARGRGLHITLLVLQVLLALFFVFAAALPKLFGESTAEQVFVQMGPGDWFRYLVGALELAGAIGLLIPRTAGLAALGLAGVMIGATYTQVVVLDDPVMALTPVVLGVLFCVIAWRRLPRRGRS